MEVLSQSVHKVSGAVVHVLHSEVLCQLVAPCLNVIVFEGGVVLDGLVPADGVEAELRGWRIVEVIDMGKDVVVLAAAQLDGFPHHLHLFAVQSSQLVLVVDTGKEKCLESHLAEKRGRGGMMSKRIDVPGSAGNIS